MRILFCHSWFRLQSTTIHCNQRRVADRNTSHVIFLMHFARLIVCMLHCMAQDEPPQCVCVRASIHPCGHLLIESESSQHFHQWRQDAFSIPHYVIKKERSLCSARQNLRHRKSTMWPTTRKRCLKRNYEGIHDRFLRDPVYCDSQLKKLAGPRKSASQWINWHKKDHSNCLSREEYLRYQKHWYLTMNKSGKNAPMRLRSDFRAAVTILNRLHRESGEERAELIPFQQYQRWHPSSSSSS